MKKFPFLLIAILSIVACSHKQTSNTPKPIEWNHYSCSWFDFDYPPYFVIEKVRNEISDTISGLKAGGEITLYSRCQPYRLRFVKSSMFDVFDSPESWRDLSVEAKEYEKNAKSDNSATYLGVYETEDSLMFHGHPAASVVFAVLEGIDTVAHYQLVVLTQPAKNLYYLNYIAPISVFNEYWDTADSIMNTIRLK